MTTRYRSLPLVALVLVAACSRGDTNRMSPSTLLPTAPSAAATAFADPAAALVGTMAVSLPSPEDALTFRQVLEAKLKAQGRPPQITFVNAEGVIVWTLEYLRYRTNGCSQAEAIDRVFAQIERRGVPPVCGSVSGTPAFPPLSESLEFRQALETKYRDGLGAPPIETFVDFQSDALYTIEFVRYAQSGCSGAESYERVFAQIDGRGVQADCRPASPQACTFSLSPTPQNVPAAGGSFTATVTAEPATCRWQISADVPWITGATRAGVGTQGFTYTVAASEVSQPRNGRISLRGDDDGGATLDINQAASTAPPPPTPPPPPPTPPPPTPPPTPPAACIYSINPTVVTVPAGGGDVAVQISTGPGCRWTAESAAGFIRVTDNAAGVGGGTVRFAVTANEGPARTASASIVWSTGRQTIEFRQDAAPLKAIIKSPGLCDIYGESCVFDGSASQGVITGYQWDFGDGGAGSADPSTTVAVVDYAYDSDWYFSFETAFVPVVVRLTVTGPAGSDTTTVTIYVYSSDFFVLAHDQ